MKLGIAILAAGALAAAAALHAEVENPLCVQTGPNQYKLTFAFTGPTHAVRIASSNDPSGRTGRTRLQTTARTEITLQAGQPGRRVYFLLTPDHGRPRVVSIRHLPLEGTPNFRDLGGYKTADGKFVRWGLLYRSGVLTHLTESDFKYLAPLGVRVVCDFRGAQENKSSPEAWIPGDPAERLPVPIEPGGLSGAASMQEFLKYIPSADQIKAWMTKIYGDFVFTHAAEYAKVFAELKQGKLPLLYHCTAGKDRTGVFSALLLLTLGVPEATVIDDYTLTNTYLLKAQDSKAPASASADKMRVLMAADPAYLESTLARIKEKYGSIDRYRRQVLGVSDQDVVALKAKLLEE